MADFSTKIFESMSFYSISSFYHEFGHALQTILSRTKYQYLGGCRACPDFVEMPSTFMEILLRDYNIASIASSHSITKQVCILFLK